MPNGRFLRQIVVVGDPLDRRRGILRAGAAAFACALGRSGVVRDKREGDGGTPRGSLRLCAVYYRPDRLPRPRTGLQAIPLGANDGWCDDPADRNYNRPVRLPYRASHERLWRDDHLYDLVVVLDYNLSKPLPGAGSAIFLHLASPGLAPTAGCVAVALPAMRRILAGAGPQTRLRIG